MAINDTIFCYCIMSGSLVNVIRNIVKIARFYAIFYSSYYC